MVSFLATLVFETSLAAQHWGPHSCPAEVLIYSYTGEGLQFEGSPPLFSVPQFVLAPGSTAQITVTYVAYDGNNLTEILQSDGYFKGGPSYQYIGRIGHFDTYSYGPNIGTGLTIVASSVRQLSQDEAVGDLSITASPNADQATYDLGGLDCPGAALLTVGYLPYWEPFLGSVQVATILGSVLIAAIVTGIAVVASYLTSRSTKTAMTTTIKQ